VPVSRERLFQGGFHAHRIPPERATDSV
jgi:hypothetical protein